MGFSSFFHLTNVSTTSGIIAASVLGSGLAVFVVLILHKLRFFAMRKEAHLPWIAFIPIIGRRFKRYAVQDEKELALKGKEYAPEDKTEKERREAFKDFIMDLPLYMIEDNFVSGIIRSMMEKGGARYQQVVLHDPSDIDDVYLWVRKEGNYFFHNSGLYHFPWENPKRVLHWDINDCRPLEDKAKDADWINPEMNSMVVAGMVNTVSMAPHKEEEPKTNWALYLAAAAVVGVLAVLYFDQKNFSSILEHQNTVVDILNNMSKRIR